MSTPFLDRWSGWSSSPVDFVSQFVTWRFRRQGTDVYVYLWGRGENEWCFECEGLWFLEPKLTHPKKKTHWRYTFPNFSTVDHSESVWIWMVDCIWLRFWGVHVHINVGRPLVPSFAVLALGKFDCQWLLFQDQASAVLYSKQRQVVAWISKACWFKMIHMVFWHKNRIMMGYSTVCVEWYFLTVWCGDHDRPSLQRKLIAQFDLQNGSRSSSDLRPKMT